jgi:hypothetical protein
MNTQNLNFSAAQCNPAGHDLCFATLPSTWNEVVTQVDKLVGDWELVDPNNEVENARLSAMDKPVMESLMRTPAPNAAALIYKIRQLHAAMMIECDEETLDQICRDISNL